MPFKNIIGVLSILPFLTLISCDSEATSSDDISEKIVGHWEVTKAIRNNRQTATLEDAYFEFNADKKIKLNLDGTDQTGDYEIAGNVVKILNTTTDGDFNIVKIDNDSMSMTTEKNFSEITFKFKFELVKVDTTFFQ